MASRNRMGEIEPPGQRMPAVLKLYGGVDAGVALERNLADWYRGFPLRALRVFA